MKKKMCEQRFCRLLLRFVFLFTILACVDAKSDGFMQCVHERNEQVGMISHSLEAGWNHSVTHFSAIFCLKLVYGVQQDQDGARGKRQSGQQYQPFRIHIHYDNTVMQ